MKTLPCLNTSGEKNIYTKKAPVKVCMLCFGTARTDDRVMRDAIALVKVGFVVIIVDVEGDRSRPPEEEITGVHLKHIFMPSWFISAQFKPWFLVKLVFLSVQSMIRLLRIPADIYHVHVEKTLLTGYIIAKLRSRPLIFDSPDLPLPGPNFTRWQKLTAIATKFLKCIIPDCEGVIVSSPLHADVIRNDYHAPHLTLIRNVPVYRSPSKSERLRQHLGLHPNTRIALYQGHLQPDRGLDRLVLAARYLNPEIVIVIMGKEFKGMKSYLEALIVREEVEDRIKILPPVPYQELLEWTASADIGLIIYDPDYAFNIRTLLPNKLFEYMMAGRPVLASHLDAISEVIRAYDVGQIVETLTPEAIGADMNAMLADHLTLARMSSNALEAARADFYWEKESQKLLHLYQDIVAKYNKQKDFPVSSFYRREMK